MGARLYEARRGKRLTQTELAEAVGAETHAAVGNWEYGRNMPTLDNLAMAAQVLRVSLDWLVFGTGMAKSIDARVRGVPKVLRDGLVRQLHDEIDKTEELAKRLPPELQKPDVVPDSSLSPDWSAKGKPKTKINNGSQ